MDLKKRYIISFILLISCLLPIRTKGQVIQSVRVDSVACKGELVPVSIGYENDREVVVANLINSLTHTEKVFLPDGISCGSMGCSYRSSVTFTDFAAGATITSVNDINFVRLNIEHSFIGDLYINITCPNGQVASLMNWKGVGTSQCSSSVPLGHCGWSDGSNVAGGVFLGEAYDFSNSTDKCDSTAVGNEPGTGWNYCWSSNTTNGYSYAPGDGLIYRSDNASNGIIDSSNVAAHTNFYHPDDNLTALIGCPLNGNWYIEILDAYSQDNGYIFEWELSLNPALLPAPSVMDSCRVVGDTVLQVNDTTFYVTTPANTLASDTTITYTVHIYGSNGNVVDTTFCVRYLEQIRTVIRDSICDGDTLLVEGFVVTETFHRIDTLPWVAGCPQVREIDITVNPRYEYPDTVLYCPQAELVYYGHHFLAPGDYTLPLVTTEGCDSIIHLNLGILDSGFSATPFFSDDTARGWFNDTLLAGCVPFEVWLRDGSYLGASRSWHTGDAGWMTADSIDSHTYDSVGVFTLTLAAESIHGCRDTASFNRVIWTYATPTADFVWDPENPVMSHPDAFFHAIEDTGNMYYMWEMPRGSGAGTDTLYGQECRYSWATDDQNVSGDFQVTLTAIRHYPTPNGDTLLCYDTAQRTITIIIDWLQFPNLVTPNGDGINDRWEVVNLLECGVYTMNEVWIYNAWGVPVFHAKDIDSEDDFWDPDETRSPDGTYYFRFMARSNWGIVKRNGTIEVVRN